MNWGNKAIVPRSGRPETTKKTTSGLAGGHSAQIGSHAENGPGSKPDRPKENANKTKVFESLSLLQSRLISVLFEGEKKSLFLK